MDRASFFDTPFFRTPSETLLSARNSRRSIVAWLSHLKRRPAKKTANG